MRRIVQPTRILFVDRNLGWSLAMFVASGVSLLFCSITRERSSDPTSVELGVVTFVGFVGLFLAALWLLFRKRAFIVDHVAGTLTILEGRGIRTKKSRVPLKQVTVRMEQKTLVNRHRGGSYELRVGAIWLDLEGGEKIRFMSDVRGSEAQTLAHRLATDLRRPLSVIDRSDW